MSRIGEEIARRDLEVLTTVAMEDITTFRSRKAERPLAEVEPELMEVLFLRNIWFFRGQYSFFEA